MKTTVNYKNPYSFFSIFKNYHKEKILKLLITLAVLQVLLVSSFVIFTIQKQTFSWITTGILSLMIVALVYILFLLGFPLYLYQARNPIRHYLFFGSSFVSKMRLFIILSLGAVFYFLRNFTLDISELEDIVKLSWTIYGIIISTAVFTFVLISGSLKGKKDYGKDKYGKIDYNNLVRNSFTTFYLILINAIFLIYISTIIFVEDQEPTQFVQKVTGVAFMITTNTLGSVMLDFLYLITEEKNKLEYIEQEIIDEKKILFDLQNKVSAENQQFKESLKDLRKTKKTLKKAKKMMVQFINISESIKTCENKLEPLKIKKDSETLTSSEYRQFKVLVKKLNANVHRAVKVSQKILNLSNSVSPPVESINL